MLITEPREAAQQWTHEQNMEALRFAATYEYPLTMSNLRSLVACGEVKGPSAVRIFQRYTTWAAACESAGVEAKKANRSSAE